jgi:carbamoyltransferase
MTICGIKLTHDGAIALIDDGKLVFSYEMEKLDNNSRYSEFCISMERVGEILGEHGYELQEIDQLVIDGWDDWDPATLIPGKPKRKYSLRIPVDGDKEVKITEIAAYGHFVKEEENLLQASTFTSKGRELAYKSYQHVSSHVLGAYCSSPFAVRKEDSFILVWDGGMPPQLFYYRYQENEVLNLGHLFLLAGYMYINFSHEFAPFSSLEKDLSIAGKVMAYVALGEVVPEVLVRYREIFAELNATVGHMEKNMDTVAVLTAEFISHAKEFHMAGKIEDRHMLTSFHAFLQELLLENLQKKVREYPSFTRNLCFAGGSALNIKWNSSIRDSGMFERMWVPPFPNDAGSAIGTACCEMIATDKIRALDWNVYSGPAVKGSESLPSIYSVCYCSLEDLAKILHVYNEPVVFLNGSAELGPRALGNRSILAAAVTPGMKKLLNMIKGREDYRPVAPICLEEDAAEVFSPGSPDPYMLYEHIVRDGWKDKVPAICHLDGTARLQTVNREENAAIHELLGHYKKLSGVPLLCNTSANFNGRGFFPDVASVMVWDKVNFIWNDDKVFFKKQFHPQRLFSKESVVK